ncbi:hypothetical protein [Flavobacterium geliluteum]|uniref:Uncharacterized protein n=1 Tax=Flavobacterium geliluteum TaxID=2816120 RepID=A0A940XC74_9FLAO|nr:hypothetical protein [Flavobacterium geliluteum]MBP4139972.1 hypothetical protein [Flavobacterium geliluteum]
MENTKYAAMKIRQKVSSLNSELLELNFTIDQIIEFWKESLAEASIKIN